MSSAEVQDTEKWEFEEIDGGYLESTRGGSSATIFTKTPERRVSEIMTPRSAVMFVYVHEVLGPLVLDRLYKSGQTQFPVLDETGRRILGSIRTDALNRLEIRETRQARDFLDPRVVFLREDYTLDQAMAALLRTGVGLFIIVSASGRMVGTLTAEVLEKTVLGKVYQDDFKDDDDLVKVVERKV